MSETFVSGSFVIESQDPLNETQIHNTSFNLFSMDLPLFLREYLHFVFDYEKRKPPYSRKFSYNILNLL